MRKIRTAIVLGVLGAAAVGIVGPAQPAQAYCDPGPTAVDGGPTPRSCSNTCQKLDQTVVKLTGRSLFACLH